MSDLQYFYNKFYMAGCYNFNLSLYLKLLFCQSITTSDNLSLKISCENVTE